MSKDKLKDKLAALKEENTALKLETIELANKVGHWRGRALDAEINIIRRGM